MIVGRPEVMAISAAQRRQAGPGASGAAEQAWLRPRRVRAGLESAYAHDRVASRWAEFLVDAAFRAAGSGALPQSKAAARAALPLASQETLR